MGQDNSKRDIPVFIVTTSSRKADHLKYLGSDLGLDEDCAIQFHQLPWEYQELQTDSMDFLLDEALERSIFDRIRGTFFIIEQTSVFLDSDKVEGPGQYFKKWWKGQTEEDLIAISQNPGAVVESGLAMNIPGGESLRFTNKQRGVVRVDGEIREDNSKYSWLSSDDFSSYFSPDGSPKVYTEMTIEEFDEYDFRRPNFEPIAARLREYSSILHSEVSVERLQAAADQFVPEDELVGTEGEQDSSFRSDKQSRITDDYGE